MTPLICLALTVLAVVCAVVRVARAREQLRAIAAEVALSRASHARLMASEADVEALMRELHGGGMVQ